MSEPSLHFTLSTIYRLSCCFLKTASGLFRDLKENLGKIFEGNINIPWKLEKVLVFTETSVVCDGTVVMKSWMQYRTVRTSGDTVLFSGEKCKFPAAAKSCGTIESILSIWNSVICIHSIFWSDVLENMLIESLCNTHGNMQGGEVRNHIISLSHHEHAGCTNQHLGSVVDIGSISWPLMTPDGCGQAVSEEVKPVPRNSQEKSQKHESVLTYLQTSHHHISPPLVQCLLLWAPTHLNSVVCSCKQLYTVGVAPSVNWGCLVLAFAAGSWHVEQPD